MKDLVGPVFGTGMSGISQLSQSNPKHYTRNVEECQLSSLALSEAVER